TSGVHRHLHSFPTRRSSDLGEPMMDNETLRLLVQHKLQDGRLPRGIGRVLIGPGGGTTCDACEARITKEQTAQEVALAGGRDARSEEHTSELQSRSDLVCRL